tara:strand:+ start:262 stop:1002 length:741 start_codon:yes stop_codon:yes gene_type:complete
MLCISLFSKKYYLNILKSQNDNKEAEFISKLDDFINNKSFFEIGFGVFEFNCSKLLNKKYSGYLLDGNSRACFILGFLNNVHKLNLNIKNVFLNKNNVKKIIPSDLGGIFSIDIDGNDYWILKEVLEVNTSFELIIVEYNASFLDKSITVLYDEDFLRHKKHKSGWYHGASLKAFIKLLNSKGYYLIHTVGGVNAFFVNKNILDKSTFKELRFDEGYEEQHIRNKSSSTNSDQQFKVIKHLPLVEI